MFGVLHGLLLILNVSQNKIPLHHRYSPKYCFGASEREHLHDCSDHEGDWNGELLSRAKSIKLLSSKKVKFTFLVDDSG